ncbi:MAG: hypothetical protein M3015_11625 [Bacteroidota bacterium]|nr:hypothetical protein [Bacteroidota bacterium]
MKKYLSGITAIILAVSFSAFTTIKAKPKLTDPYWFQISNQYTTGQAVAQKDAVFLQQSATAPLGTGCTGSTYDCVAGFNTAQVNASHQLIDDSQVPGSVPRKKN